MKRSHGHKCAGKNRPLDEDELEFVNEVVERERSKDRQVAAEELQQILAYREVSYHSCLAVHTPHVEVSFIKVHSVTNVLQEGEYASICWNVLLLWYVQECMFISECMTRVVVVGSMHVQL